MLAAPEHHVLEKVRKTALARFHLVSRARSHHEVKRDKVLMFCGDGHEAQPVGERVQRPGVRKKSRTAVRLRQGALHQYQYPANERPKFHGSIAPAQASAHSPSVLNENA